MKHAPKLLALVVISAVLLVILHSHVREHSVPHPHAVKASVAKPLPRPHLPVAPAAIPVQAAEHLVMIGSAPAVDPVALPETAPSCCRLRGPPCKACGSAA